MPNTKFDRISQQLTDPRDRIPIELAYCYQIMNQQFDTNLLPFDLTAQQFNLLRILRGTHPRTQCMQEIKSKLIDKNSDATRLVVRLVGKGFLVQKSGVDDKRRREIGITKKGLALLGKIDHAHPHFPYSLGHALTTEQAESLCASLKTWREHFKPDANPCTQEL